MTDSNRAYRGILNAHRILKPGFGTEAAVYGTLLVSGLIAVSAAHGKPKSGVVLITVAATVLVFWGAHVYAGTVARLGDELDGSGDRIGLRVAFRESLRHSFGLLGSAAVPSLVLLAGTTRIIPDDAANDVALWSGVVILAVLGYIAFLRRGSSQLVRVVGALGTASFGLAFVALKAFVH